METRDYYAGISDRYRAETDGVIGTVRTFNRSRRTAAVLETIDRHVPPGSRIADLGCGPAQLAAPVIGRGHRYVGIDLSREMFEAAATALREEPRAAFHVGSIESLPLPNDSADAALAVGVIEYLAGDDRWMAEVDRILAPGGVLILTFPNALNPLHGLRALTRPLAAPLIRGWGRGSVQQTVYASGIRHRVLLWPLVVRRLRRAGFRLVTVRFDGFAFALRDRPLRPGERERLERRAELMGRLVPVLGGDVLVCARKPDRPP